MKENRKDKPIQIKDFSYVFERHPKESFVAIGRRREIFNEIDKFLKADTVQSPYLFIIGESGIGKTALMANYIRDKQDDIIHYFIEYDRRDLLYPDVFIKHLYCSLGRKFNLQDDNLIVNILDLIELLNRRIQNVCSEYLKGNNIQAIFIDALDECLVYNNIKPFQIESICEVINILEFANNFRVIISCSSKMKRFINLYSNNTVQMTNSDDNNIEIEHYLRNKLPIKYQASSNIQKFIEASEGNFQFVVFSLQLFINDNDDSISTFIQRLPKGINNLYNYAISELESIYDSNEQNISKNILSLISLLPNALTSDLICDICSINPGKNNQILKTIRVFLNLSQNLNINNTLRWQHISICEYMLHPSIISKSEQIDLYKLVIMCIRLKIEDGKIRDLPSQLLEYIPYISSQTYFSSPEQYRELILQIVFHNNHIEDIDYFTSSTLPQIKQHLYFSITGKNPQNIFFYCFYLFASDYFCQNNQPIISWNENDRYTIFDPCWKGIHLNNKDHIQRNMEELSRALPSINDIKSNTLIIIQKYIDNQINGIELINLLKIIFLRMVDQFHDISEAYYIINDRTNDWINMRKWQFTKRIIEKKSKPVKNNIIEDNPILTISYEDKFIVIFKGNTVSTIDAERSFAMLLNLAARRKANTPYQGLTHKLNDLKDDSNFTNYSNLRKSLKGSALLNLLKSSGNKDSKVYLNIDQQNILISKTIRNFISTLRTNLQNEIDDWDSSYQSINKAEQLINNTQDLQKRLEINEGLVDNAIMILGMKKRSNIPLKHLIEKVKSVQEQVKAYLLSRKR
jgi:hypothetical protein